MFYFEVFPCRLPEEMCILLTACRKAAEASYPLPPTGPYHSGSTTLSNRIAASRKNI